MGFSQKKSIAKFSEFYLQENIFGCVKMSLTEHKILQRARAGSRHRERCAELIRHNDLVAFNEFLKSRDKVVLETKRSNHVAIPPRPRPAPRKKQKEKAPEERSEVAKTSKSWLSLIW